MKAQKNRQQQNEVYILLWRKKSMPEKSTSHKAKAMQVLGVHYIGRRRMCQWDIVRGKIVCTQNM